MDVCAFFIDTPNGVPESVSVQNRAYLINQTNALILRIYLFDVGLAWLKSVSLSKPNYYN